VSLRLSLKSSSDDSPRPIRSKKLAHSSANQVRASLMWKPQSFHVCAVCGLGWGRGNAWCSFYSSIIKHLLYGVLTREIFKIINWAFCSVNKTEKEKGSHSSKWKIKMWSRKSSHPHTRTKNMEKRRQKSKAGTFFVIYLGLILHSSPYQNNKKEVVYFHFQARRLWCDPIHKPELTSNKTQVQSRPVIEAPRAYFSTKVQKHRCA
jgi:hypothetical protein